MRKKILEITRTQQYADSNLVPMPIGLHQKSKGKDKDGKDARNESYEKVKDDDRRRCYFCRETGHAKSQSRTRLEDLADAEVKPVTQQRSRRWQMTTRQLKRKSSCACVKIETTMRSDAGGTPTGSERVKLISAIPKCETCQIEGTCAGPRLNMMARHALASTR